MYRKSVLLENNSNSAFSKIKKVAKKFTDTAQSILPQISILIRNLIFQELLRDLPVEGAVMEPVRVMTCNRLAATGEEWTDMFEEHNRWFHTNNEKIFIFLKI